jgi:hypothetical protein
MTRTGVVLFGHSQALGRVLASDMGLAEPYSAVPLAERNAAAGPTTEWVNEDLRVLSARDHAVAGVPAGCAGPELRLGRLLDAIRPDSWAFVKMTVSGSGWEDEWMNPAFPAGGPPLLGQLFDFVDEQMAAMDASPDIWIPVLGEADANESPDATNCLANMRAFRAAVRPRYPGAGIVLYQIPSTYTGGSTGLVVDAAASFAAETSRCALVSSSGIPTLDGAHFTPAGVVMLADRLAPAVVSLIPNINTTPFDIAIGGQGSSEVKLLLTGRDIQVTVIP